MVAALGRPGPQTCDEGIMLEIKDSVALITGGGGGIGLALGRYWVQNGGKLVLADISEKFLAPAEAEIKGMK